MINNMIKHILKSLLGSVVALGLMTSCGEDRSGEYYALIGTQTWIYHTMQENYLYYEDLPAEEGLNFFTKPQPFLASLLSDKDQKNGVKFSHVDSIYTATKSRANSYPSFGIQGAMIRVPNGSEAIRILYTESDSPAEEAALKRGDWIIAANGKKINSNSYTQFISRPTEACTFTLGSFNGEGFDTLNVVQMPAPRVVVPHDLLESHFITSGNRKALYLLYNEFGEDQEQLKKLFQQMAGQTFDDVILDLRYNPGGYVTTSQVLTSNLAPAEAMNQPFLKMTSNDKLNKTEIYKLDPSLLGGGAPLNYQNLYVITTNNTASASEILINGLRPYMKGRLFQVGTATFGKNVAQTRFFNEQTPQVELWLTTFSLTNSEDFGDYYANGLVPDYEQREDLAGELGQLGTEHDSLLLPVLHHMANGSFPSIPTETKVGRGRQFEILYHSVSEKDKWLKVESK